MGLFFWRKKKKKEEPVKVESKPVAKEEVKPVTLEAKPGLIVDEEEESAPKTVEETKPVETVKKPAAKKPAAKKPAAKKPAAKKPAAKKPAEKVEEEAKDGEAKPKVDYRVYHVSKRESDGMWQVKYRNGEKAIKLFKTKAEAMEYTKLMAENQHGKVVVHASKGEHKGQMRKR